MELLQIIISNTADVSTIGICIWLLRLDKRVYRLEILQEKEKSTC